MWEDGRESGDAAESSLRGPARRPSVLQAEEERGLLGPDRVLLPLQQLVEQAEEASIVWHCEARVSEKRSGGSPGD